MSQIPLRRNNYISSGAQEDFIVPLLLTYIKKCISIATKELNSYELSTLTVLDVGCGRQSFKSLLESYSYNYESLDMIQNVDQSVDYIAPIDCPCDVLKSIIPNKYSLLLVTEVLEHVLDLKQAFVNMTSLLNPNGILIITTPFIYPLHEEPYDYQRLTCHAIKAIAEKHGLSILSSFKVGSAVDVIGTLLSATQIRLRSTDRFQDKILSRLLVAFQRRLRDYLLRSKSRFIAPHDGIYMNNVFVLRLI